MAESSFVIGSSSQRVSVDSLKIEAKGDDINPVLAIPFTIDFIIPQGNSPLWLLSLRAGLQIEGIPYPISTTIDVFNVNIFEGKRDLGIAFSLSQQKIERIERNRRGDLRCTLHLFFNFAHYAKMQIGTGNYPPHLINPYNVGVPITLDIPQSHWAGKILPRLHYKECQLIELQTQQKILGDGYNGCIKELDLARDYMRDGDYDKCVAHCRSAINPIRDNIEKLKPLIESKSEYEWIKKISTETASWFEKITKETFNITSKTHHTPSTGHFNRNEAEVVYLIAVAIVKYASDIKSN